MPILNVSLPEELDRFIAAQVDALRSLEREDEAKVAALRKAIEEGEASGIAEGDVFAQIQEEFDLR